MVVQLYLHNKLQNPEVNSLHIAVLGFRRIGEDNRRTASRSQVGTNRKEIVKKKNLRGSVPTWHLGCMSHFPLYQRGHVDV